MADIYKKLSEERKLLQEQGEIPMWYTTSGWQLFKEKYQYEGQTVKQAYYRIARQAASHLVQYGLDSEEWSEKFFQLFWKGWLSPSTPVLSNMGTHKGLPVSCSGGVVPDSVYGFYESYLEAAILTKNGFGTSGYLGSIRPRGSKISTGGKSSGVKPVIKHFVQDMQTITQGTQRRGAFASYIEIEHADFDEVADLIQHEPDDLNIGWVVSDKFTKKLQKGNKEATRRYKKAMKIKMMTGKGYFFFKDKANRQTPKMYKDHGLEVKASNLCAEIVLHSDQDHSFTCVLSSMNLAWYDDWKDTDAPFVATIFLDCVAEDFLVKARTIKGLEKVVRFTEKSRALGLGVCGFHTYTQSKLWAFEGFDTHLWNIEAFKNISEKALAASQWMSTVMGEPEWCKGYGTRNSHNMALMPTKATALLQGGISEGINPDPAMVFTQATAGGEMDRISPAFLTLMKNKGQYNKKTIKSVVEKNGSVQHLDWLTDEEKLAFRTAFEIDQKSVLRLASTRQKYIDQGQSLNLFFAADEDEGYISEVHQQAFMDENILSLYYIYTLAGVQAAKSECLSCM